MKKLLPILLFLPFLGFSQSQVNCSLLEVIDVNIDNSNLIINIVISDGNSSGLQYPYIAYTVDGIGETIQNGNINLFGTMGLDTTNYGYGISNPITPIYPLSIFLVHTDFSSNGSTTDTCILSYHPSCDSVITTFNYIDSSSTPYIINFSIETFGLGNNNFGYGGFILLDELGDTVGTENINTAGNVFGLMEYNTENRTLEIAQNITIPFNGTLHLINGWFAGNPITSCIFPITINGSSTSIKEYTTIKKVLKVIDLLGRETKKIGQPLLYLYDDGTVDKKIIIE